MAEDIVLGIKVEGAQSLSSLKKEFKDLQTQLEKTTEGTKEYDRVLRRLGDVKDEIGDLRDTISALNPEGKVAAFQNVAGRLASGFQAATGAAALFGAEAEELQQTLIKVQAATAFAEGIRGLSGLKDAFTVLGTVIKANPIFFIASAITAIIAALALYNREQEKAIGTIEDLNISLKAQNDLYKEQNEIIDLNNNLIIENLKQKGATAKQINAEILRQNEETLNRLRKQEAKATQLRLEQLEKNKESYFLLEIEGKQDQIKLNQDTLKALEANETEFRNKRIEFERKSILQAARIKTQEVEADRQRRNEASKQELRERKAKEVEYEKIEVDAIDAIAAIAKKQEEDAEKRKKFLEDYEAETIRINRAIAAENERARQEDLRLEKEQIDAKRAAQESALAAISSISQAYFNIQLNSVKGNAAEELKIKKKQFEVDKALSIARATIDGIRSVQAALTIPPPAGQILAGANAILAAANIAKIASTKFDSGSTTISASVPSTGGSIAQPINPVAPVRQQDQTNLNAQGYVTKVIVVEKDITDTQNRVNRLKVQASY
jgi:hypothetical protein